MLGFTARRKSSQWSSAVCSNREPRTSRERGSLARKVACDAGQLAQEGMKENAKVVLPKIAPFNEEGENDVPATLKEDEESKTRGHKKRVGWGRSVRRAYGCNLIMCASCSVCNT